MLKELQDICLSEKEARVYLAALELGPTTAEKLAKHAKVNRSTTYVQLESLMKTGLISTYEENKKTFFAPESPELLRRLISKQKEDIVAKERDLTQILPNLIQQFQGAGERPVVRFFPGKAGIASVREEVLTVSDKQLYVVFSHDTTMSNIFSQKEIDDYTVERNALQIRSNAIYTNQDFFSKAWTDELTEVRFVPDMRLTMDVRIFGDKTALFSMEGNLFAMLIDSKQVATSMKMIFNVLWAIGKKK